MSVWAVAGSANALLLHKYYLSNFQERFLVFCMSEQILKMEEKKDIY